MKQDQVKGKSERIKGKNKQLRRQKNERSDGADAFIPASAQLSGTSDDLAELLAEQYLREASGDENESPLATPTSDESAEDEFMANDRDVTAKYSIPQNSIEESR